MTPKQHAAGFSLVAAALSVLILIPLVSADVRRDIALPFGNALAPLNQERALLVFAGYPGCAGICPTVMNQLAAARRAIDDRYPGSPLGVTFVNLHLDATDRASTRYATAFHPQFRGYSTNTALRGELQRALAQSGSRNADELRRHRGNVYLYHRRDHQWTMARVYSRLPSTDRLLEELEPLLSAPTPEVTDR